MEAKFGVGQKLRKVCADAIEKDPITYCEAYLGKNNVDYVKWIQDEFSWGGAIEICLLSAHYKVQISCIDAFNFNFVHYGESAGFNSTIYLYYTGTHYDPLYAQSTSNPSAIEVSFKINDELAQSKVVAFAKEQQQIEAAKAANKPSLRCALCKEHLGDNAAAEAHYMETEHLEFENCYPGHREEKKVPDGDSSDD